MNSGREPSARTRPNLLVIMADQLRHDWLGATGTNGVSTPNIDALAARGRRFTQTCTNAAICVPARTALATGRSPEQLGSLGNDAVLGLDTPTHYQHLRDHGYHVGVVGKLDLAKSASYNGRRGDRPPVFSWGFTHPLEGEGKMHAGLFPTPQGPYGFWLQEQGLYERFHVDYAQRFSGMRRRRQTGDRTIPLYAGDGLFRDSVLPTEAFEDHWLGQQAASWLEHAGRDFPWYLFVSFVGPHDPFDPPTEWADRFRDAVLPAPIPAAADTAGGPASLQPWPMTSEQIATARRQYTAAVALIDEQVGVILSTVERLGIAGNTIVVLTADHGEMLGDHGVFQKSVAYESAMRVPLIVAGPGIEPGVSDALIELADLGPTLCELAGLPAQADLDARSFAALLDAAGEGSHRRVAVCSEAHYIAIRSARHKVIRHFDRAGLELSGEPDEVYDLITDPTEQHNLDAEDPTVASAVRDELVALARTDGHVLDRLAASGPPVALNV